MSNLRCWIAKYGHSYSLKTEHLSDTAIFREWEAVICSIMERNMNNADQGLNEGKRSTSSMMPVLALYSTGQYCMSVAHEHCYSPVPCHCHLQSPPRTKALRKSHLNQQKKSVWTWWCWWVLAMLGLAPKENQKVFSWASPMWGGLLGPAQQETSCHRTVTKLSNFLGCKVLGSRFRSKCSAELLWMQGNGDW